ncbi:UNVERIFIED_CONTAM: 5-amino-6-(5-phospho-D-ribitylamino)uracil phosphatase, chloroplastic [Sesamum angustifolium]|uniref:5-amino-6-(5-phospho-D-ribitylamino)uracil phosphatase, chloroplastic n=1 Tax=Sesamum angustifolium TaxID=2727405 RepID=A0AAW2QTB6_9LAMI
MYELGAANLVVKHLDELSIIDLKNLAAVESAKFGSGEPELEIEPDEEDQLRWVSGRKGFEEKLGLSYPLNI